MKSLSFPTIMSFVLLAVPIAIHAQGTEVWTESSYDALEQGSPKGVAIRSDGALLPVDRAKLLLTTPATAVWSVAVDAHGNAYLGTGSPAQVLKVTPDGKSTTLLETKDVAVQVVRLGPDGMLYAATLPHGKIYRIDPNAAPAPSHATGKKDGASGANNTASLPPAFLDTDTLADKPAYIWDMAFDSAGRLYVATGGPAAIYRIDPKRPSARPEKFFTSQEQHVRCLLFAPDGTLYAGSDGRGLVYRITPDGKGTVLFESPKREVPALAMDPHGNLYVAALGDRHLSGLPPLNVQPGPSVTATVTVLVPGTIQSSSDNTLLPDGSIIYQLSPNGAPRELWTSKNDVIYALAWDDGNSAAPTDGPTSAGLLAASGNLGHLYKIFPDGVFADVAHLDAKQATALFRLPDGTEYVGTSNTGKLYRMEATPSKGGVVSFTSDVFDAKFFSQWGRASVRGQGNYELMARSGNIEQPELGWGAWARVLPGAPLPVAPARFLQWKARLHPGSQINEVAVYYLPQNVAPVVDEVVVQLHARVNAAMNPPQPPTVTINFPSDNSNSGIQYLSDSSSNPLTAMREPTWATVRWKAHDDNGDHLRYDVYYRGDGEANWQLLARDLKKDFYSFDMGRLPDGGYTLRVVASDAPSNPPGTALTGYKDSDHFLLDTTPPVLSDISARVEGKNIHVTFHAKDALSSIARAYCSVDAGQWQYIGPVGRLSDSPEENYDFTVPLPARDVTATQTGTRPDPLQHVVALRVVDRTGNAATGKVVVQEENGH